LREIWRKRIGAEGFKVGVVWQGNPNPEADRARSMPVTALAPLSGIAGVRLMSLQKGGGDEQLSNLPASMRIETLAADFDAGADAFVDTAAVMTCLDLIITVTPRSRISQEHWLFRFGSRSRATQSGAG
jgi:hypothetical protein